MIHHIISTKKRIPNLVSLQKFGIHIWETCDEYLISYLDDCQMG